MCLLEFIINQNIIVKKGLFASEKRALERLTATQQIHFGISHTKPHVLWFNALFTSLIDKLFKTAICHHTKLAFCGTTHPLISIAMPTMKTAQHSPHSP